MNVGFDAVPTKIVPGMLSRMNTLLLSTVLDPVFDTTSEYRMIAPGSAFWFVDPLIGSDNTLEVFRIVSVAFAGLFVFVIVQFTRSPTCGVMLPLIAVGRTVVDPVLVLLQVIVEVYCAREVDAEPPP